MEASIILLLDGEKRITEFSAFANLKTGNKNWMKPEDRIQTALTFKKIPKFLCKKAKRNVHMFGGREVFFHFFQTKVKWFEFFL